MYPSNPKRVAKGFKKFAMCVSIEMLPIETLENSQMIIPAGAATAIALPKTNKVLSKIERTITFPICGFRKAGSSNIYEEGIPLRIVLDKIFDISNVINIPKTIIHKTHNVDIKELAIPVKKLPMKIVAIVIKNGNLPITRHKTIS